MLLQLNPPIPVYVPSKQQTGLAHILIDYGPEFHLIWTVVMDLTGEVWSLPNPEIRGQKNITMGRLPAEPACTCPPVGLIPDCSSR
jgi:hypothetical protein